MSGRIDRIYSVAAYNAETGEWTHPLPAFDSYEYVKTRMAVLRMEEPDVEFRIEYADVEWAEFAKEQK